MTILWLNHYYFVLLDCFVSVLLFFFFTSLIKFFFLEFRKAWESKAFLQASGWGGGVEEMGNSGGDGGE